MFWVLSLTFLLKRVGEPAGRAAKTLHRQRSSSVAAYACLRFAFIQSRGGILRRSLARAALVEGQYTVIGEYISPAIHPSAGQHQFSAKTQVWSSGGTQRRMRWQ